VLGDRHDPLQERPPWRGAERRPLRILLPTSHRFTVVHAYIPRLVERIVPLHRDTHQAVCAPATPTEPDHLHHRARSRRIPPFRRYPPRAAWGASQFLGVGDGTTAYRDRGSRRVGRPIPAMLPRHRPAAGPRSSGRCRAAPDHPGRAARGWGQAPSTPHPGGAHLPRTRAPGAGNTPTCFRQQSPAIESAGRRPGAPLRT